MGEHHLIGSLHQVEFANGQEVEFVVEHSAGWGHVHAARHAATRTLWVLPHQTRGTLAQARHDKKWTLILSVLIPAIGLAALLSMIPFGHGNPFWFAALSFGVMVMLAYLMNIALRLPLRDISERATKVFHALGYERPAEVDLPARDLLAEQAAWQAESGQRPPARQLWRYRY